MPSVSWSAPVSAVLPAGSIRAGNELSRARLGSTLAREPARLGSTLAREPVRLGSRVIFWYLPLHYLVN
jgi:hypothetical protein